MKFSELQDKTIPSLYGIASHAKKEMVALKLQLRAQQVTNTALIRQKRREVARALTAIKQKVSK